MSRSLLCIVLVALLLLGRPAPAEAGEFPPYPDDYHPPVEAPVVDPFRPPAHIGGSGNRGLEYGTIPGTEIRAAKSGQVSFAGAVAGALYVTVAHPDGLRSTYSYLLETTVAKGQFVDQSQVIGTAGEGFHFGVLDGASYIDPAQLFGPGSRRARLVPAAADEGRDRPLRLDPTVAAGLRVAPLSEYAAPSWQTPVRRLVDLAVHFRLLLGSIPGGR